MIEIIQAIPSEENGGTAGALTERYAAWLGETGNASHSQEATIASAAELATGSNRAPEPRSGQQDWLGNLVSRR